MHNGSSTCSEILKTFLSAEITRVQAPWPSENRCSHAGDPEEDWVGPTWP